MENATKALLIAGGVLIAIIIISIIVMTFQKTGTISKTYNKSIDQETIAEFNTNFTKYLGQELSIHQVVTICNYATKNKTHTVQVDKTYTAGDIKDNLLNKYNLKIDSYDNDGFISKISITIKSS